MASAAVLAAQLILLLISRQVLSRPADENAPADTSTTSSQPQPSPQTRGVWSDMFGLPGVEESDNPNESVAEDQDSNQTRAGHQSATIISATTYPEGAKPTKPAAGQGNSTEGSNQKPSPPVTTPPPPPGHYKPPPGHYKPPPGHYKPPPGQYKPPPMQYEDFELDEDYDSPFFGMPQMTGSQKPIRPPVFPGLSSQLSSTFGSSSFGSHPGGFAPFMQPPQQLLGGPMVHPIPPPHPFMFGSPFSGTGAPFGSFSSLMSGPGQAMLLQEDSDDYEDDDVGLPPWIASIMRNDEASTSEKTVTVT